MVGVDLEDKLMNKKIFIMLLVILFFVSSVDVMAAETKNGMKVPDGVKIVELDYHDFYTDNEITSLQKLVTAEAGNQDIETQKLVALVVLNRTKHDDFPSTIDGVINHKYKGVYQFSCVPNGMYANAKPTDQVKQACEEAMFSFLNEMKEVPDELLYFNSIGYFDWSTVADYKQSDDMYFSTLK